jgi:large subunit ribosomal protein L10
MAREVKELMLAELAARFQNVQETGCVLVRYQGLKAADAINARRLIAEHGGSMSVVKNSLFALAMERQGAGQVRSLLDGPIAVITAEDPVAAARAARQGAQLYEALQVRGAYVDGAVLEAAAVERLADIPSREVLLSQIAGALLAPLRRLAYGLLARPRELLSCVDQLRERKEAPAEAPQAE